MAAAPALALFLVQLALNAVWSWLFFGLHHIGWALVDLAALWLAIGATLLAFWAHRPLAGLLMVPYLLWVSFCGPPQLSALAPQWLTSGWPAKGEGLSYEAWL